MNKETYKTIPDSVFFCAEISDKAKLLYALILSLSRDTGICWATNSYLASQLNCTKNHISKIVSELKKHGLIEITTEYKENSKEIERRTLQPIIKIDYTVHSNMNTPLIKNAKENNINIINNIVEQDSTSCISQVKEIVEYLNAKVGTSYKASTKATQKHINARLKEGYTVDDFKKVINRKTEEWQNTDMSKYLRPDTLFGAKFESYLNIPLQQNTEKTDPFRGYDILN
ncbi:MAG: conserved phage C-terminal domain-containing protein [Ruminococcus sp.]|nr:conserved phage C-terminal domain-containing protein [Ruminococcus sp.]